MSDAPLSTTAVQSDAAADDANHLSIFNDERVTQVMVIAVAVICGVIFAVGSDVGALAERGVQGSLAQPPVAIGGLVAAIILLVVCTALGTVVLQRRWFLAGLMTATAGLSVWSAQGGPMNYVLFRADTSGVRAFVFFEMLVELIVFYGIIAAIWNFIWVGRNDPVLRRKGRGPTAIGGRGDPGARPR